MSAQFGRYSIWSLLLIATFARYFKFLQIITEECGIAQNGLLLDEIIAPHTSGISLMSGERTER